MTDRIALVLGLTILAGLAADFWLADGAVTLWLARQLWLLLETIAFWR